MRKLICLLLAVCLLAAFALPAFAAEDAPTVSPRYSHISYLDGAISVSGGTVYCNATGTAMSSSNKVQLSCQLQGYTGSRWAYVKSWSNIGTYSTSLSKSAATSSEYTSYRLQITCKVYDSSYTLLESTTVYKNA